jgi:hypothetical protein
MRCGGIGRRRSKALWKANSSERYRAAQIDSVQSATAYDHILGDLLHRAASTNGSLLRIAYAHVKAYEARRAGDRAGIAGAA